MGELGRIIEEFALGAIRPLLKYRTVYAASVVSQSGSTVDVKPISTALPALSGVPLQGLDVRMHEGDTVLVVFIDGDPTRPVALPASVPSGEPVVRRSELQSALDAIRTSMNTHTHGTPSGTSTPTSPQMQAITIQGSDVLSA